jgi:hypothetical protein
MDRKMTLWDVSWRIGATLITIVIVWLGWKIYNYANKTTTFLSEQTSVEEITELGYYTYSLPESELQSRGWQKSIYIEGVEDSCDWGLSNRYHTIRTLYRNTAEEMVFWVGISDRLRELYYFGTASRLTVSTDWASENAQYYTMHGNTYAKIIDEFGWIVIIIGSDMDLAQTVELIESLEFTGSPENRLGRC